MILSVKAKVFLEWYPKFTVGDILLVVTFFYGSLRASLPQLTTSSENHTLLVATLWLYKTLRFLPYSVYSQESQGVNLFPSFRQFILLTSHCIQTLPYTFAEIRTFYRLTMIPSWQIAIPSLCPRTLAM